MIRVGLLLACMAFASTALAQDASQRPLARANDVIVARATTEVLAIRPVLRPEPARGAATKVRRRVEENLVAFSPFAPAISLTPKQRSVQIEKVAADLQATINKGALCGDVAIQGDVLGAVAGRGQCGISSGVRVKSVAGVRLEPAATLDCQTANALKTWVENGLQPALNGEAISMRVVSHYSCRFRNSAASGRLSEHSFGRAIDIAGIGLSSGREVSVLTGWSSQRDSNPLRKMWQAACGPFGTVLGPEANRFHRDHFHFDTARYRAGSYCR